ncbi:MAG: hypothetical protein GY866_30580 [Proteobacteria bacterium]|nr:hypothetical protein [Pseudomonadota bacterium]
MAPLVASGDITKGDRNGIFSHFLERISHTYRLISQNSYSKAAEKVFDEIQAEQCTEGYCIYEIKKTLQVERLAILEVAAMDELTQIKITLVRDEDRLVQEDICSGCNIETLQRKIDLLLGKIATEDTKPPTKMTHQKPVGEPDFSRRFNSNVGWHLTIGTVALVSIWKALDEAKQYNDLDDENEILQTQYSSEVSKNELINLRNEHEDNTDKMKQNEENIRILNGILAISLIGEMYLLFFKSDTSVSSAIGSGKNDSPLKIALVPASDRHNIVPKLNVTWSW